jgi:glutathione S-transferase
MLKLYGFGKVNAFARSRTRDLRILWALEEMQLPFEVVGLDHPAGDLSADAYRLLSPFAQIPSIDDEGLVLAESGAILLYLAKKSGRLIPSDVAGEAQVTRWCFAALTTVEAPLQSLMVHDWTADSGCAKAREFLVGWVDRVFSNLELWLAKRDFIAADAFTVADILMAHVLSGGLMDDGLLKPYPAVAAYRDRCMARPAWKRTLETYLARVQVG